MDLRTTTKQLGTEEKAKELRCKVLHSRSGRFFPEESCEDWCEEFAEDGLGPCESVERTSLRYSACNTVEVEWADGSSLPHNSFRSSFIYTLLADISPLPHFLRVLVTLSARNLLPQLRGPTGYVHPILLALCLPLHCLCTISPGAFCTFSTCNLLHSLLFTVIVSSSSVTSSQCLTSSSSVYQSIASLTSIASLHLRTTPTFTQMLKRSNPPLELLSKLHVSSTFPAKSPLVVETTG